MEVSQPGTINLAFVEELYASYLRDPSSVSADWQEYFAAIRNGDSAGHAALEPTFARTSIFNPPSGDATSDAFPRTAVEEESRHLQDRVDQLIRAYRICGHAGSTRTRSRPLRLHRC